MKGLRLAVKDKKVWAFALLNVTQLLGLSFVNFFPTSVFLSLVACLFTRLTTTVLPKHWALTPPFLYCLPREFCHIVPGRLYLLIGSI